MATRTIDTTELVDQIMRYKDEHGLSDRALADALDISHGTPSNWRRGMALTLDRRMMLQLSLMLARPISDILELHYGMPITDEVITDADTVTALTGPYRCSACQATHNSPEECPAGFAPVLVLRPRVATADQGDGGNDDDPNSQVLDRRTLAATG